MNRTLSDKEIDELLTAETFCHLACCEGNKPYIVPLAYGFHNNVFYGQTTEGKKTEILRNNPLVCVQVQRQDNKEWRSAMCWGTFEELDFEKLDKAEAVEIAKRLTTHLKDIQDTVGISVPFAFGGKATPLSVNDRKSTLFRILVTEKTGRHYTSES